MKRSDGQRLAVMGAGYWGKNLVRNFFELGCLHTVCERDDSIVAGLRAQCPGVRFESSVTAILDDPDIEAVAVATPAPSHGSLVRRALEAGKDVYVEKPLCLSVKEGEALVRLARERKAILMVGHLLWYHPAILKLKALIDDGTLGRVQYIYSSRLNLGKLRREENVLWSFAPHDVSVILGLLRESPDSVQAQGGNFLHRQIADTTVSLLNFASGVRAHIFVSWLHPYKEQKLVVVGERKMAVFDDTTAWKDKLTICSHSIQWHGDVPTANKVDAECVDITEVEPLKMECQHFLDCVRDRRQPRTDGEEGLRVLRVLNACQSALERGSTFSLSEKPSTSSNRGAPYVHETAVVDENTDIGEGTKIWHFSHVLPGSSIGANSSVGQNVVIGPNVRVGKRCKIQNNVSIYEGVTLEDEVFCGPSIVFTNVINPRAAISRKHEFKETHVSRGTTIGANATIICGNRLGEYSFIGAGAVVTRDVPAYAIVVGNPARVVGWMCHCGVKLARTFKCTDCGSTYRKTEHGIEPMSTNEYSFN